MYEYNNEYLPTLICAKQNKDKQSSYIKVREANEKTEYYCPLCNNVVKLRAKDSKHKQPHFYHTQESCMNNEKDAYSYVKKWIKEKMIQFVVDNNTFVVSNIENEISYQTKFGEYKPDLVVETTVGNKFILELCHFNPKDDTNSDIWSEIDIPIVEVKTNSILNCSEEEPPRFKTIFKDGKYTKEFKIRDKSDKYKQYKDSMAKYLSTLEEKEAKEFMSFYDWFWKCLREDNQKDMIDGIENCNTDHLITCCRFLKKANCSKHYLKCLEIATKKLYNDIRGIVNKLYSVEIVKTSAKTVSIKMSRNILNDVIEMDERFSNKFHDGLMYKNQYEPLVKMLYENISKEYEEAESMVKEIYDCFNHTEYNFNTYIRVTNYLNLKEVVVGLSVNRYSDKVNEYIEVFNKNSINCEDIDVYLKNIDYKFNSLENKRIKEIYSQNVFDDFIKNKLCNYNNKLNKISKDFYCKYNKSKEVIMFKMYYNYKEFKKYIDEDVEFIKDFDDEIFEEMLSDSCFQSSNEKDIISKINNCKNKIWECYKFDVNCLKIILKDNKGKIITSRKINTNYCENYEDIENKLCEVMNDMISDKTYMYNNTEIRFLN